MTRGDVKLLAGALVCLVIMGASGYAVAFGAPTWLDTAVAWLLVDRVSYPGAALAMAAAYTKGRARERRDRRTAYERQIHRTRSRHIKPTLKPSERPIPQPPRPDRPDHV
jgi:hypothetical protein